MICLVASFVSIASPKADASGGLIAHYKFDGDFKDASGNGNDGSRVGDISFKDDGVMGKCAVFSGGFLNVKSTPALNLGKQFTISVWVMVDGDNENTIIDKLTDIGNNNSYAVRAEGKQGVRMTGFMKNYGGYEYIADVGDLALAGNWSHLVITFDGQNGGFYQNGSLIKTSTVYGGDDSISPSGNKVMIGNDENGWMYKGRMDDLRIYNYALSSDEIKALYNEGTNPEAQTPPAATTGTTTPDTSVPGTTTPGTAGPGTGGGPVTIINNNTTINQNTNTTTNNANTNTNITGSTIANSNVASNNQTSQTTSNENAITVTQYVSVMVNGQPLQSDVKPFVNADGRTMLPVRAIAEALGANVQWDEATQTATLAQGGKTVKVPIGQNKITVDGKPVPMDTAAAIKDGRTLLPVRAIGEALGAKVGWDEKTSTVKLEK